MSRVARFSPAALAAVLILAGCGGGSSPVQPAAHPTAAPASSRTSVGTATLTLVLPKVLAAKKAQAVAKKAAGTKRPQFVDPQPVPTAGSASNNLLDIYVDGSLLYDLDGNAGSYDSSIFVQATSSGAQTLSVPLFSSSNNMIVVVEFDTTHTKMLAIGESNLGTFNAGSTNNVSLTMQMNASYLAIVDLPNETDPAEVSGAWGSSVNQCDGYGSASSVGVYAADANLNFVPAAPGANGSGGTPFVTATGVSDDMGITTISAPQTQFPGSYNISWDGSCDFITVTATAPNPANAIFSDVVDNQSYYNGTGGANQGIYNLYSSNPTNSFSGQTFQQSLYQASTATVNGTVDVQNDYLG